MWDIIWGLTVPREVLQVLFLLTLRNSLGFLGIKHHHRRDPPHSGSSASTHNISTNVITPNGSGCHFQCKHFHMDHSNIQWSQRVIYLLSVDCEWPKSTAPWCMTSCTYPARTLLGKYCSYKAHTSVFFIQTQILWRKLLQMSLKLHIAERRYFLCHSQRNKSQFLLTLRTAFPIFWVTKTINNNNQSTLC